jgi:hypothetical protein
MASEDQGAGAIGHPHSLLDVTDDDGDEEDEPASAMPLERIWI